MSDKPMMRAVVVSATSIDVVPEPRPEPAAGEVRIQTSIAGVCGSDTHAAHGLHPFIALPYHPGHEVVGVVESVGDGVRTDLIGVRVTVEPTLPCWRCKMCTTERHNLCESLAFFGCGWSQGGMAEWFTVRADRVHVVPPELDDRAACLMEPLATPVHAVRLGGDVTDKAVVILGAGTIGLLLLRVVKTHGARRVVVTDPQPDKRQRALDLGADAAVDATAADAVEQVRTALGESADVVFDCVAIQSTMNQAIAIADKAGTVVVVGVPTGDVVIPLAIIQDHQIRIQGSATYLPDDLAVAAKMLVEGDVDVDDIVTAVFPLDAVSEAFATSGRPEHVKVQLSLA